MASSNLAFDEKINVPSTSSSSSGNPGTSVAASFYLVDLDKGQRKLSGVHVQMYIAGVIGTGLFLGLGQLLPTTGPLGVILVFLLVGSVASASMVSVTEMAVFAPVPGSLSHYAGRWVDPALGFAVGWNYFYTCAIALPAEITAAAVLISFWDHNSNNVPFHIAVLIVFVYIVNILGQKSGFVVFYLLQIIGGLVINLGGGPDHTRKGFEYWKHPGFLVSSLEPGALGYFLSLSLGITNAAFSMCGMEIITFIAAETRNPRRIMVTAMRTVFFHLFLCYVLTGLIVGMLIPSNDPALFTFVINAGQSPFVLVFNRAGVKILPHIVNAVVLTSAFSSANSRLYSASRFLFALGVQGQAPRFVTTVSHNGLPYVSIIIGGLFSFLAFLNVKISSGKVFSWFVSLSAVGGLLNWLMIGITYLRFYYGSKAQGIERHGIHGGYRSVFQPYAGMYVVFCSAIFILVGGLSVLWHLDVPDLVVAYINVPIFVLFYVGYKISKRTKIIPLSQLDFFTGVPSLEETVEKGILEKPKGVRIIRQFVFLSFF
ncbi:general amino acid permease 1 [Russula aff. rugulosa BPL654]|nr:general amino acid permease 1 [Russula aff. rugulosa BPL654]